ncbi:uncharacterized protein [Coffea arabica]|uniref:Lamin-B receptor of TUDOR domain-containing protein n=1 Tax=Coffea arabica TaxID=13443 RepID=A0A6P6T0W9_COFAR|nr:histone-lysine N-methyltransferase ATX2-like [Coffea arabica]XP_027071676.1 histone-lysine N-methyltransferase ATX2-like [Coffea arabica]XP_027071730.1 histone-lysine N-methyltransferase ATX2-like [Coffea arabica]
MKTRFRKRCGTQEVKVDKGTVKASGSNMDVVALKEDVNKQDESIVIEGKATSEPSEQEVHYKVQGNEEAEMRNVAGEEQNLNVTKELKKRKRSVDVEFAIVSPTDKCSSRLCPRKEVPSFQMVDLNENNIERIVGMRIKVYWPESQKWFAVRIKSFNREKMLHTVNYDDGDVEELQLKKDKFELEVKPKDGFHIKQNFTLEKARRMSVVMWLGKQVLAKKGSRWRCGCQCEF